MGDNMTGENPPEGDRCRAGAQVLTGEMPGREGTDIPAAALDGVCAELGTLPAEALVTEKALAAMLGKCVKSIKRAVKRGELPQPVRIMGAPTWTAGAIVRHIEKRLEAAARKAERERARLGQLST
jgi:predicted DNA-binding transcriptional regulator AlpA